MRCELGIRRNACMLRTIVNIITSLFSSTNLFHYLAYLRVFFRGIPTATLQCNNITSVRASLGNESVPKIVINNTINLCFKTTILILVISIRNSFRVLFGKIACVYFI